MKKTYLSPAIETAVVGFSIMQTADPTGGAGYKDDDHGSMLAPKQKPF